MKKTLLTSVLLMSATAFAQTGKVGVDIATPTETFHVNGTARVQDLPSNGTSNAIYNGATTKATTFNATRTVVADANGVLGTVDGLPGGATDATADISKNKCYASTTQNFGEVTDQSVTQIDFPDFSFRYFLTTTPSITSYLQIRNNTTQTLMGYTSNMGGNGGGVGYTEMVPGQWVTMSGVWNWDAEYAGEYVFWTDQNTTGTRNDSMHYYSINYMGQKRTATSYPNVCLSVREHH